MKSVKSEKGAITVIVLVSVLFMVAFLISSYVIVANKVKAQKEITEEIKRIYESDKSMKEIYDLHFSSDEVIPIYTEEQYLKIGSGELVEIAQAGNKYYTFSPSAIYVLKNSFQISSDDWTEEWENEGPEYFIKDSAGFIDYSGYVVTKVDEYENIIAEYDGRIIKTLNIADGIIEIRNTGYKIIGETTIEENYVGAYCITGTTTTNYVKIMSVGDFDITLKDLNIDVSDVRINTNGVCAFNANYNRIAEGVNVIIKLEGENVLKSGNSAAGLGFANANPNVSIIENENGNGITRRFNLNNRGKWKLNSTNNYFCSCNW